MSKPHVIVLGAGPAGCGAAFRLRKSGLARVTVVEKGPAVGGNAGSFVAMDQYLDFGSHRLHSACDPEILEDIQRLLGEDLQLRPRNGRIRLRGKWLRFPLKTTDLLLRLDRSFALGVMRDMLARSLFRNTDEGESFASVLKAHLGGTICDQFYFPYARKIWGDEPDRLSGIQAHKRVSAVSLANILKRLLKPPGGGKFYYPRQGFGQITQAYARESEKLGAEVLTGWAVTGISRRSGIEGGFSVEIHNHEGERKELEADHIWSTIPVTMLCRMMSPPPPGEVLQACEKISYRAMILVYLTFPVDQFSTTDAHYFPEEGILMTRLSEPKNYFGSQEPRGMTTICAELPCHQGDRFWSMSDDELGDVILQDLAAAQLPATQPIGVFTRRLPQAYPLYRIGYENNLEKVDSWIGNIRGVLSFGRQGLFAHDNTHHALYMAYSASKCLEANGEFNLYRWSGFRKEFETHVVED